MMDSLVDSVNDVGFGTGAVIAVVAMIAFVLMSKIGSRA